MAYTLQVWRVLLVDDSAFVRNAMQVALEPFGLDMDHAKNGEIAVAKAMSSSWDLIFLDIVMPQMDGPTALREMRARGNTTPVVLVTSVSTATVVAEVVKLGGVHYIGKPFTPQQIRAVASRLLELDAWVLVNPPRVLLQYTDPALPDRLRKLLPRHVAIDLSRSLTESLDLAEDGKRNLVLIESDDLLDEMTAIGNVMRRALPAAGIFALSESASQLSWWNPQEGLDGLLPRNLDEAVVRGFLYQNFLRPFVMLEGMVARISGFRGNAMHFPAYLQMLVRVVVARTARLDRTADLIVDLRGIPPDPEAVVAVIAALHIALKAAGAAPLFRVTPAMKAATIGRLERIIVM
jgi:CheY-like chemotaxis protein